MGFIKRIFKVKKKINKISLDEKLSFNPKKVGDELNKPTKYILISILPLIKRMIKSIAHITGGGIYENLQGLSQKS